jgi:hypothetical protein
MSSPSLQGLLVFEHRARKRTKVEQFFLQNLGTRFTTHFLHERFGSSVRTRISEINRRPDAGIIIRNPGQRFCKPEHSPSAPDDLKLKGTDPARPKPLTPRYPSC